LGGEGEKVAVIPDWIHHESTSKGLSCAKAVVR
jgi:hypothetical protein